MRKKAWTANSLMEQVLEGLRQLRRWIVTVSNALFQMEEKKQKSLAEIVLDYYTHRNQVANSFGRGRNKAIRGNLQKEAGIIAFMQNRGIHSTADLEREISTVNDTSSVQRKVLSEKKAAIRRYSDHISNAKAIEETGPVYEKYRKTFFAGAKKKYYNEHAKELRRFHAADNYFKKQGISFSPELLKQWESRLEKEKAAYAKALEAYEPVKEEMRQLREIQKAVNYAVNLLTC